MLSLPEVLQRAGALYRAGEWGGAEELCTSILKIDPRQLEAIELLGVIAAQSQRMPQALDMFGRLVAARPHDPSAHSNYANVLRLLGRFDEALRSYERAVQLGPDYAEAHSNRGNVLRQLGRLDEALQSYERALQLKPDLAEAHSNRGNVLQDLGLFDEALRSYDCALRLKPAYAEAESRRGNALQALGRFDEALRSYERALLLRPNYAEAHNNRGNVLRTLGRLDEALQSYERALRLKPDYAEGHSNRGALLEKLGRFDEALESFDRALRLKPSLAEAHNNRGNALQAIGRFGEALQSVEQALRLTPDFAEAHNNRGNALQAVGRFDEALESFERALQLKPEFAGAYSNRGTDLLELGRIEEALQSFGRALQLEPDLAGAHTNIGYAALLTGDFTKGWLEHEWRWKANPRWVDPRYPDRTRWLGRESVSGKTIVLHSEQGFGDALQFSRYVTQVAALGATVILEVPAQLAALLERLQGVSRLVVRGESLPAFDYHCPLMSLPLAFGTSVSTIPAQVPYIVGDRVKKSLWSDKLGPRTKLRVGLVWSGGFRPDQPELWAVNVRRNVPLADLAALKNAEISFYSLQKGQPAESELADLKAAGWTGPDLIDFTHELHDFSDTAALIENLDLVISVDTATAHLAGALAKPVWIMNRFNSCWRWLLNRTDSPWYPTARLYRQQRAGDWGDVIERIRLDLSKITASGDPGYGRRGVETKLPHSSRIMTC